jgi:hypothetical protein
MDNPEILATFSRTRYRTKKKYNTTKKTKIIGVAIFDLHIGISKHEHVFEEFPFKM